MIKKVDVGMSLSISYHHYYPCFGAFYDCRPYFIEVGMVVHQKMYPNKNSRDNHIHGTSLRLLSHYDAMSHNTLLCDLQG